MTLGDLSKFAGLVDWSQQIPKLLELTLRAWDQEIDFPSSKMEDDFTDHLVCALQRLQAKEHWAQALSIDGQRNEYDSQSNTLMGRNDITFQLGAKATFTWECKVLHRGSKTLYSEYRTEGMMRFLGGQYHSSESTGAMLAYILDGNAPRAILGLSKHFKDHLTELQTTAPVLQTYGELNDERLFISKHNSKHHKKIIHGLLCAQN